MAKKAKKNQSKKASVLRKFKRKGAYTKFFKVSGIEIEVKFFDDVENGYNYCLYDDQDLLDALGLQKAAKAEKVLNRKLTRFMSVKRLQNIKLTA